MESINTLPGSLPAKTDAARRFGTANPGGISLDPFGTTRGFGLNPAAADHASFGGFAGLLSGTGVTGSRFNDILRLVADVGDKRDFFDATNADRFLGGANLAVTGNEELELFGAAVRRVSAAGGDLGRFLELIEKATAEGDFNDTKRLLSVASHFAEKGAAEFDAFLAKAEEALAADPAKFEEKLFGMRAFSSFGGTIAEYGELEGKISDYDLVRLLSAEKNATGSAAELMGSMLEAARSGDEGALDALVAAKNAEQGYTAPAHEGFDRIFRLADGEITVKAGESAALFIQGIDAEDGVIAADAHSFSSEEAGELATGQYLDLSKLEPGVHHVIAKVTDSSGLSTTAKITINVTDENGNLPDTPPAGETPLLEVNDAAFGMSPARATPSLAELEGRIRLDLAYGSYSALSFNAGPNAMIAEHVQAHSLSIDFQLIEKYLPEDAAAAYEALGEFFVGEEFTEFKNAALALDPTDDATLEPYMAAVEKMFNELEGTLGLSGTALDWVETAFKREVEAFFDRVQSGQEFAASEIDRMRGLALADAGKAYMAAGRMEEAAGMTAEAVRLTGGDAEYVETLKEILAALRERVLSVEDGDEFPPANLLADAARTAIENSAAAEAVLEEEAADEAAGISTGSIAALFDDLLPAGFGVQPGSAVPFEIFGN